ncbi:hypothetical protein DVH05_026529 [Phytophthora capsici]|nr:hypothetical protein DVH05_026529 [Phytophthora capsici]
MDTHFGQLNTNGSALRTLLQREVTSTVDGETGAKSDKKLTMEEKLRRWKLTKQNRHNSPSNASKTVKRNHGGNALPHSIKKSRRSQKTPASIVSPKLTGCSSSSMPVQVATPASTNCVVAAPGVHSLGHTSVQSLVMKPVLTKEHQSLTAPASNTNSLVQSPVSSPSPKNLTTTVQQPALLAKNLIQVGIKFEKQRRIFTAFSIFKRACHVLPTKSAKLVERLQLLESEHPEVIDQVPSQEMPTANYMVEVLKRDLMEVLNYGTEKDLTELHGIGDKRARLVVDIRPFRQLKDLQKVPGISPNTVTNLYQHHTNWENHL